MRTTRTVTRDVEETADIRCNLCGATCLRPIDADDGSPSAYGLIEAEVTGGYFSEALADMSRYVFSLCEDCLKQIFDRCVLPPRVNDVMGRGDAIGESTAYDPQWKELAHAQYEASVREMLASLDAATPNVPPTWVRTTDGNGLRFDRANVHVGRSWINGLHTTISKADESELTPAELEDARATFVPSVPFDVRLRAVRAMYIDGSNAALSCVSFSEPHALDPYAAARADG